MLHLGSMLATMAVAALLATPVHATSITPSLSLSVQAGSSTTTFSTPAGTANGDGSFTFSDNPSTADFTLIYNVVVFPDPHFSCVACTFFELTNETAFTTEFAITVASTVSSVGAPTTLDGAYGTVDFFDDNNNGLVQYGPSGTDPFWEGQIDSITVATLGNVGGSASGGAGVFGSTSGLTLTTLTGGPAVTSTIGMVLHFELTAGDRIVIPTTFAVVPEAESGALLGAALIAIAALRRRKQLAR